MTYDIVDLNNWMFLNQPGKIMTYIDNNYVDYAYDDILWFIKELVISVISENIETGVSAEWSEDSKKCYQTLKEYYEHEKYINSEFKLKER